jgi:EAL domain-containing protein (putative c-di-GMP-specific phosphodiesterase class I)
MDKFLNSRYQDFTHPDDLGDDLAQHQALVAGDVPNYSLKKRYRHSDGHWFWVLLEVGLDPTSAEGMAWAHVTRIQEMLPQFSQVSLFEAVWAGLRAGDMTLDYQPIVDLESRETVAYEALIRWRRDGVLIPPDNWLPSLDETIFPDVCLWTIRQVVADRKTWAGPDHIAFAVNASPVSLNVPGFAEHLLAVPRLLGFDRPEDRRKIWFEVTEQSFMTSQAVAILKEIDEAGHSIVIDDFGIGYSNLQALSTYNAKVVKIDKTITRELPSKSAGRLIGMIVSLSEGIGFKTVAEGIESAESARLVQALGVDFGQGWHFGRPGPLPI